METRRARRALSRRRIIGGLAALGGTALLAACGGTPPAPTAAPAAPTTAPVAPTVVPAAATAATPAAPTTVPAAPTIAAKPSGGTLKFSLIPDENSEKVLTRFKPFVAFLEKELDMKVETTVGTDYSATIEALKARKVDVTFQGPFSYVLASQVADADVVVVPGTADGKPSTYHSIILTKKTSGIAKLEDLKGKTFSFADPASASGHLIPRSIIVKSGIDVDKEMKPVFAGGHDASVLSIANGKVDAGATYEGQLDRMDAAGVVKKADLLIITKSDPIPDGPIAVRKDYDPAMREKLALAFEKMPGAMIKEAYGGTGPDRFIRASDSIYDSLREVAKVLKLDLTKLR
jgi:phosphonate transport system substrate-binding protein